MDKAEIAEMKEAIRRVGESRIKKLQQDMENAISALSRFEDNFNLMDGQISERDHLEKKQTPIHPSNRAGIKKAKARKTAAERIEDALSRMTKEFTRKELLGSANNDGIKHRIQPGTFAGIFPKLIRDGKIMVVTEKLGSKGGIYLREKHNVAPAESSPVQEKTAHS